MSFADQLKKAREKAGLTQAAFAARWKETQTYHENKTQTYHAQASLG